MENQGPTQEDWKLLRDQIDQLQIATAEKTIPWYRQRPSLTSLVALLFSLVTFAITQRDATRQEIRAKKEELRRVLAEIISLQIEVNSAMTKALNPQERAMMSSLMNSKRVIYLESAERIVDELERHVSSSEYFTLAIEKSNQSDFAKSESYMKKAVTAARDSVSKATAWRNLGGFYFQTTALRDVVKGREAFGKALEFTASADDDYSRYSTGYTYEQWGVVEQIGGDASKAPGLFGSAREYYQKLSPFTPLGGWAIEALDSKITALKQPLKK